MLKQTALWLIYIFCLASRLASQEPAYLHYDVSDGLPSALVYSIEQDSRGFMWFGTDKGLARFDGVRFKVYDSKNGLPDPEVLEIFEDSRQRLWLSCFSQKPCYIENGKIITSETNPILDKVETKGGVLSFYEDNTGAIWVTGDPAHFYCLTDSSIVSFNSPLGFSDYKSNIKASTTVVEVGEIDQEMYAFANYLICKIRDQYVQDLYRFYQQNVQSQSCMVSFFGERILYVMPNNIKLLECSNGNFVQIDSAATTTVSKSISDNRGRFWLCDGSGENGAICFDHKKDGLRKPKKYLKGHKISHVFQSRDSILWFATLNDGVYALPQNTSINYSVEHTPLFFSNNFTTLSKFNNGQLVAGDDSGNIYVFYDNKWNFLWRNNNTKSNRIRKIIQLNNEEWMAATDRGILFSDSTLIDIYDFIGIGAPKSMFFEEGKIWVGTSHKLLSIDEQRNVKIAFTNRIVAICNDHEKNLWVGGLNGLFSEKDSFTIAWGDKFHHLSKRIIDIKLAGNNTLWVATPGIGLLNVEVKNGKVIDVSVINNELKEPIDNIQSIFVEPNGKVWLSTNKGVYSIDNQLNVFKYDAKNGLISNDVNDILVDHDTLWAATTGGLSKILLSNKNDNSNFPTFINGVRYRLKSKKISIDLIDNSP